MYKVKKNRLSSNLKIKLKFNIHFKLLLRVLPTWSRNK